MENPSNPSRAGRGELLLAALVALVVFAWPLRGGLLRSDRVIFGVDTAAVFLPWSEAVAADPDHDPGVTRPRNPAISDQGQVFYPSYLWAVRSWLDGELPAWNPLVYAGAPGIASAQSGALDPQVAPLVPLYKLGGRAAFDMGLSILAWLRLAAAGLGAYLLARILGLKIGPAAFSGLVFGLSGYVLLWLNHSLGHVTPLLPWVLLGLEGTRGACPLRAVFGTSLALTLAILGGHPETAFYVGATAGLWALAIMREDLIAGALGLVGLGLGTVGAAAVLLPFVEYLQLSGAKAIRDTMLTEGGVDLLALGAVLVLAGLGAWFARLHTQEDDAPGRLGRHGVISVIGLALAVGGTALFLSRRGLEAGAAMMIFPDFFGAPGSPGGYQGQGNYVEATSGWIALAALGLAIAAALSPRGVLRRRGLVVIVALLAGLLVIGLPGLLGLYRTIPLIGLGATERLGAVSALFLALLGGEALQAAPRISRLAGALILVVLGGGLLAHDGEQELPKELLAVVQEDELFGLVLVPDEQLTRQGLNLEGWLHPGVAIERGSLTVQRLDPLGRPISDDCFITPLEFHDQPSGRARRLAPERLAEAPRDARFFRPSWMDYSRLGDGVWRFAVDLFGEAADEIPVATRVVAISRIHRGRGVSTTTLVLSVLTLIGLVILPRRPNPWWTAPFIGLALAQGLIFARGTNPAVPRAEAFPETRTEQVLADMLGPHRFFSDPLVLPPNTGLVRGLRGLDGYDGMDVASFNAYRALCLPPGVNGLLGWNARSVDLQSGAFRLFGVGALVLREPMDAPGWELHAGPLHERRAETWIYRATDPMPRAFCVSDVASFEEVREQVLAGEWDPARTATIESDWRPAAPFTRAQVTTPTWTNNTVRMEADLDGDGLLILTDQAFPGWRVYVDGEKREVLTANAIFRAVALDAGEHSVEFRYQPWTLTAGIFLSIGAFLVSLTFLFREWRRERA